MNSEATVYLPNTIANVTEVRPPESLLVAIPSGGESVASLAAPAPAEKRSDEELLLQVGNGSKEALSILFHRHARLIFNVAQKILRDASEAEDLRQEVFLFLFQKAGLFDAGRGSASSWIMQIAYHRALNRRKYLDFRQHYNVQELNEERLYAANGQALTDQIAGRAILNRLREHLSDEQQQTFELHFFEGYGFREIAEKTGQTFGNVRNHYYRGLEQLRSHVFPQKRV